MTKTEVSFERVLAHPLLEPLTLAIHETRHGNDEPEYDMAVARDRAFRVLLRLLRRDAPIDPGFATYDEYHPD